jgi:S-DNA-T family DNA segregation ATPase FtsK/SpoIIIE
LSIARSVVSAAPTATILGVASRRSPLSSASEVSKCATTEGELTEVCNMALMASGPTLLLVDDSELVEDPDERLASLVSSPPPQVHVVAAGNADALRSMYGHWTQTVRRHRAGLLLQPALDRDGELLTARLPYRVHGAMPAGRGFLVCSNEAELVQTAS